MCEYCGCQEIEAIGDLTAEHDEIRVVADRAVRALAAGDDVTVVASAVRLVQLLVPHTTVEEQALFPAMAGDFPDHVAVLESEHRRIEPAIEATARGELTDGWQARFTAAVDLLSQHIFKEQDGLFPAALATLTTEQWDALDGVRAQVGSGLAVAS